MSKQQTSFKIEDARTFLKELKEFYMLLWDEWRQVEERWSSLSLVWRDEQFDQFEPLYNSVSSTYRELSAECERYILFLQEQIQKAEKKQAKLMGLLKDAGTVFQLTATLAAHNNSAIPANPPDPSTTPQTPPYSQVQEQKPTSCPLVLDYNALPRIARSPNTEEQLQVITESDGKDASKKRQEDIETSILADRDSDAAAFSDRPPMPPA